LNLFTIGFYSELIGVVGNPFEKLRLSSKLPLVTPFCLNAGLKNRCSSVQRHLSKPCAAIVSPRRDRHAIIKQLSIISDSITRRVHVGEMISC